MRKVIHDGPEQGLYDWKFTLLVDGWDSNREIRTFESEKDGIEYEAFLPRYGVTVRYQGNKGGNAWVELGGEAESIEGFHSMVEGENSRLLAVMEQGKEVSD